MNRELSREFTVPGLKRIATEVKKRLGPDAVPMSIFARGGFFINEDFIDSDYDIIQLDWTVDGKFKASWSANKTYRAGPHMVAIIFMTGTQYARNLGPKKD